VGPVSRLERGEVNIRAAARPGPARGACDGVCVVSISASVLIAEDDYNFRDTLEDVLVEDGHSVVCARNGAEALVALSRIPRPALVLLDLHMPVMDGVTFLNHLRQRPDQADFEVIVMSALVDPEWFGKLPGVIRAMRKPFDIEEIQSLVAEFAERRPARRPSRRNGTRP
jgi:CheY-like chemotaxis protein